MPLSSFDHIRASSIEEASSLAISGDGATSLVAGGTDLLGILKDRVHRDYPTLLVDLKGIPDLDYIREDEEGIGIGALASLAQLAKSSIIRERYPLLAEAARMVASPQIRNMGTIGGNICQEPRCWYYRNPEDRFHCLRKGGAKCHAIAGENRFHSIFGAARVGSPGCRANCPGNVDIPLYLGKVREGDLDGAARILLQNNPMPAITGRVCPHFCEKGCNRGELDEAVSVRAIERRLGDHILENAAVLMPSPAWETGKKIAVVGSGPAGLAAAFYLCQAGHEVRVFEKMSVAGGMLAYGIPAYRMPKEKVADLVAAYEAMGVAFEVSAEVGRGELTIDALKSRFDAVFLATGAWQQKTVSIPGAELLDSGLDFLFDIQKNLRTSPGEKVLVIGGGNVAVDVAISALRLGAKDVTMACLEAREIMPAFPEDLEEALREGVKLLPSWGPLAARGRDGRSVAMDLVRCSSVFDSSGAFRPTFDPSRTMSLEADRIFLAIGQGADLSYAGDSVRAGDGFRIERGLIVVNKEDQSTSATGVFAGGDATSGPASVVEALAAGKRAAHALDVRLTKRAGLLPASAARASLYPVRPETLRRSERVFVPALALPGRGIAVEDVTTITRSQLEDEARRCIDCGCVAVNSSDLAPALVVLGASIRTTRRSLAAEDFFAVSPMKTTALAEGELVTEIRVPAPQPGSTFAFKKFRVRKSIDFPIVSVAAVFVLADGAIAGARIAFGAVSPEPLRATRVEEFLIGRRLSEETAEAAASIAATGCFPLECNGYKVQVLRALVRKAILESGL